MLAAQLFGTTGVAVLLLLGKALETPSYWDVALVLAVLAAITVVAFVRRAGRSASTGRKEADDGAG
jgi:multicomponent Na+:H+ antiporter subunit F